MKLASLSAVAQCSMKYATREDRLFMWDWDSLVWQTAEGDIMLTDDQLDELEVVGFTAYDTGIRVRLDIEVEAEEEN